MTTRATAVQGHYYARQNKMADRGAESDSSDLDDLASLERSDIKAALSPAEFEEYKPAEGIKISHDLKPFTNNDKKKLDDLETLRTQPQTRKKKMKDKELKEYHKLLDVAAYNDAVLRLDYCDQKIDFYEEKILELQGIIAKLVGEVKT